MILALISSYIALSFLGAKWMKPQSKEELQRILPMGSMNISQEIRYSSFMKVQAKNSSSADGGIRSNHPQHAFFTDASQEWFYSRICGQNCRLGTLGQALTPGRGIP